MMEHMWVLQREDRWEKVKVQLWDMVMVSLMVWERAWEKACLLVLQRVL